MDQSIHSCHSWKQNASCHFAPFDPSSHTFHTHHSVHTVHPEHAPGAETVSRFTADVPQGPGLVSTSLPLPTSSWHVERDVAFSNDVKAEASVKAERLKDLIDGTQ